MYRLWDDADGELLMQLARQLRRQTPFDADEIEEALRELVHRGVLKVGDGCISEPEMVQRAALSEKRAAAGKIGGQHSRGRMQEENAEERAEAQAAEAAEDEPAEPDSGFETVWADYPRKLEKAAAHKAYSARLRDGWSYDELHAAVRAYADTCRAEKRQARYIKHLATFFGAATPFVDYLSRASPEAAEEFDDLKDCF